MANDERAFKNLQMAKSLNIEEGRYLKRIPSGM